MVHGLEEFITFNEIQRCFRFTFRLMVVHEVNNVIVVIKSFFHQHSAKARIHCSTLTIPQRERSSLLEVQVQSTALLAYRRQWF